MLTMRRKILLGLLLIDATLGIFAAFTGGLTGWIFLNFIALVIWALVRKARSSKGLRSYDTSLPAEKEYGVESQTLKGDTVKSKKEKIIADYLYRNKLRYEYDPPVYARRSRRRLIGYADFLLLDYNIYIEYWGLVDVDDPYKRQEYNQRMRSKMAQYYDNGIKFMSLYERNLDNLDWVFRKEFRKAAGFDLPQL
jgi:hypothetical protein